MPDGTSRTEPSSGAIFLATAVCLCAALILGGGTTTGFLADAGLQIVAVVALAVICLASAQRDLTPIGRWGIRLAVAMFAVPLLQLVPLPPGTLTWLPGHKAAAETLALIGQSPGWRPLSVAPEATTLALLAGLPALAVFLGTARLTRRQRQTASLLVLLVGATCVLLGLVQVAQGPGSMLRPFAVTNPTEAVGYFANRNHFAALLYGMLLVAAAWAGHAAHAFLDAPLRRRFEPAVFLPLVMSVALVVVVVAAQTFTRSRAGLVLTIIALVAATLVAMPRSPVAGRGGAKGLTPAQMVLGAGVVGIVMTVQLALYRVLERFGTDPLMDARIPFARNTGEAALAHFPLGTGLGSFMPVYGLYETKADALVNTFANRAHNDVLEVLLEAGIMGALLLVLLLVWVIAGAVLAWRTPPAEARIIDTALPRAAVVLIVLLLLHSLVDYPLRTAALLSLLAFAAGLLVPAPLGADDRVAPVLGDVRADVRAGGDRGTPARSAGDDAARRQRPVPGASAPAPDPGNVPRWPTHAETAPAGRDRAPASAVRSPVADGYPVEGQAPVAGARWGEGTDWPEAWQREGVRGPAAAPRGKTGVWPDTGPAASSPTSGGAAGPAKGEPDA